MSRNGVAMILAVAVAVPVSAYEYPLSDTSIREAYFLGAAKGGQTKKLLAAYSHTFPMPQSGPHIASVTIETPYAYVVEYSSVATNFHAVDAEDFFLGKPAFVRVRIQIDLTASYTPIVSSDASGTHLRSADFWKDFRIKLIQGKGEIAARAVQGQPIYVANDEGGSSLSGAFVTLEYPADKLMPSLTKVKVLTPDGQDIQTDFDLAELR